MIRRALHRALEHVRAALPYPVIDWPGPTWSLTEADRRGAEPEPCAPGGCEWCRERGRKPRSATEADRG